METAGCYISERVGLAQNHSVQNGPVSADSNRLLYNVLAVTIKPAMHGRLAQTEELAAHNRPVAGSNPAFPTKVAGLSEWCPISPATIFP